MIEYIDKQALLAEYDRVHVGPPGGARKLIEEAPAADVQTVVHGRWEKAHIAGYLKCNCCQDAFIYEEWLEDGKWNYCPNCGARMDGDPDG